MVLLYRGPTVFVFDIFIVLLLSDNRAGPKAYFAINNLFSNLCIF